MSFGGGGGGERGQGRVVVVVAVVGLVGFDDGGINDAVVVDVGFARLCENVSVSGPIGWGEVGGGTGAGRR